MSSLNNTLIRGNLDILPSDFAPDQGLGNVYVSNVVAINGTDDSSSYTTGTLVVAGGLGIAKNIYGNSNLNVNGITNLNQTNINTNNGIFAVTGTNKLSVVVASSVELDATASSHVSTSVGAMTLSASAGNLILAGNTGISATSTSGAVVLNAAATSSFSTSSGNITVSSPSVSNFTAGGTANITGTSAINLTSSAGGISLGANSTSNFSVTGAFPLTASSTAGSVILQSGKSSTDSIKLNTTSAAGGISVNSGTNGIAMTSTGGAISLAAQNASSNFSLSTNTSGQDLTISVSGTTDSSIILTSSGNNTDAIGILATDTAGGISIVSGTGGVVGSTTGTVSLSASAASNFTSVSDLSLISSSGNNIIQGGAAASNAIRINATNIAGGIVLGSGTGGISASTTGAVSLNSTTASNFTSVSDITLKSTTGNAILQGGNSVSNAVRVIASSTSGGISMSSGTGGMTSTSTGTISLNSAAASNHTIATTANNQDLTLAITGATDSKVILSSTGTSSTSAILLSATAGGITASATSQLSLQTTDTTNGIKIGTSTTNVPIVIGNGTASTVTIGQDLNVTGNLLVSGTTTTVNTVTMTVEDNIVVYNSAPAGTSDGGVAVKRFQTTNGSNDDVVSDVPNETSALHGGVTQTGTTSSTIKLNAGASSVTNYYNGWWIKITSGVNAGNVRRIKIYNGTTKTATIYATGDTDVSFPASPLDFASPQTNYDGTSYSLYGNVFIADVYQESSDRWILCSVPIEPGVRSQITPLKYISFQAGNVYSTGSVNADSITGFSGTSVNVSGVSVNSGVMTGVVSINGNTPDTVTTVSLANNTTSVIIPGTSTIGCYKIMVKANYTGGPMAQFIAAKSDITETLTPSRLISSRGSVNFERLDMEWTAGNTLKLKFQSIPGTTGSYSFNVKVISP